MAAIVSRLFVRSATRPRNTAPAKSIAPSAKARTTSGLASTVSTTVPNAAKRVMLPSPIKVKRVYLASSNFRSHGS